MEILVALVIGYVAGAMLMRWKGRKDRTRLETIIGQQRQRIEVLDRALENESPYHPLATEAQGRGLPDEDYVHPPPVTNSNLLSSGDPQTVGEEFK